MIGVIDGLNDASVESVANVELKKIIKMLDPKQYKRVFNEVF